MGRYRYTVTLDGEPAADYLAPDPHDPPTAWTVGSLYDLSGKNVVRLVMVTLLQDSGEYDGTLNVETPGRYADRRIRAAFVQAITTGEPVPLVVADFEPLTKADRTTLRRASVRPKRASPPRSRTLAVPSSFGPTTFRSSSRPEGESWTPPGHARDAQTRHLRQD